MTYANCRGVWRSAANFALSHPSLFGEGPGERLILAYASAILAGNEGGVMAGISVFFPAYNDGGTIASMVLTAAQTLADRDR